MSISREVTVWCDAPDCPEWGPQGDYATTAQEARLKSRRLGWRYRDGRDLCPAHAASARSSHGRQGDAQG